MSHEGAGPARDVIRAHLRIRRDQRTSIEQLAETDDLTKGEVVRRLLDLGLAHWGSRASVEEVAGVAS